MAVEHCATLVVGGGIMGLAVAWALVRRGQPVTVVEQGAIPNPLGSSVDRHRLIRYAYGAETGYMRMVADAYPAWERLWVDLGVRHYAETGTLILESGGGDWAARSAAAMAADGLAVEAVSPAAAHHRWPMLRADFPGEIHYAPSGGVLFAEPIVRALGAWLDARPELATLVTASQVVAVDAAGARIALRDGRTLAADRLVIAAGPWTGRLLPELAAALSPSRQVVVYFAPPADLAAAWAGGPMILDIGTADALYAVPPVRGTGLKIGRHAFGPAADPDIDREPAPADIAPIRAAAAHCLAGFDRYGVAFARTCFYTVADEERFIVRPVVPDGRTWVLAGFSGHGFKFGPLIGERLAAALCGEAAAANVQAWAAGRG
ncbi:MAG: FAD-dependent oxidoreductase [Alphaproteobacteria bacterium]